MCWGYQRAKCVERVRTKDRRVQRGVCRVWLVLSRALWGRLPVVVALRASTLQVRVQQFAQTAQVAKQQAQQRRVTTVLRAAP